MWLCVCREKESKREEEKEDKEEEEKKGEEKEEAGETSNIMTLYSVFRCFFFFLNSLLSTYKMSLLRVRHYC